MNQGYASIDYKRYKLFSLYRYFTCKYLLQQGEKMKMVRGFVLLMTAMLMISSLHHAVGQFSDEEESRQIAEVWSHIHAYVFLPPKCLSAPKHWVLAIKITWLVNVFHLSWIDKASKNKCFYALPESKKPLPVVQLDDSVCVIVLVELISKPVKYNSSMNYMFCCYFHVIYN